MKEYKSSLFVIGKNIAYGIGGAFVAALVLNWFFSGTTSVILGILVGLAIIYFAVVGDNITVVLDDGKMSVYRIGGRLLHQFQLDECSFYAKIVTTSDMTGGDSDCTLRVTEGDGSETSIDCSMLGRSRFMELLEDLGVVNQGPVPLRTTRSGNDAEAGDDEEDDDENDIDDGDEDEDEDEDDEGDWSEEDDDDDEDENRR